MKATTQVLMLGFVAAAIVTSFAGAASASHTVFSFEVDRFEADGNGFGPLDGTPGFVDEFDDGSLSPSWFNPYGTAFESGGSLFLTNPGTHVPTPLGGVADISIAASTGGNYVWEGLGDFQATSWWVPLVPDEGNHYQMTVFTFGGGGSVFNEAFGLGIQNFASNGGLTIEQHLTEINLSAGIYQNTMIDHFLIEAGDVTGPIGFRVDFDDSTDTITSSFTLDGGTTWLSPFPSGEIFVGRTTAQFLLSSDPEPGAAGTTTTTTTIPGTCSAVGCTRGAVHFKGRLGIKNKDTDKGDSLTWKLKKGEATPVADFGNPLAGTAYEVCMRNESTGATIFQAAVPAGGTCGGAPCWKALGGNGYRYRDSVGTAGGVRALVLKAGGEGKTSVTVKGKGQTLLLPALPLPVPVTMRVRASTGACWADTFTASGVIKNTAVQFSGKAGSPSGAFLDQPR
jgi:hypothetical protein